MVEDATIMIYQQVASEEGDTVHFDLKKLKQLPNFKSYLYNRCIVSQIYFIIYFFVFVIQ